MIELRLGPPWFQVSVLATAFVVAALTAAVRGQETTRVSVSSAGGQCNHDCRTPAVSADGRFVAFWSEASNLVSGDNNRSFDVFVHDRLTGTTTVVSVDSNGVLGNKNSGRPSISADGRFVAFWSVAWNLVAGDTNQVEDVFVHDRQTGATTRVSVDSAGGQGNEHSWDQSLSADGRVVAFTSRASNLVPSDTNDSDDVFVHDRQTGATTRVSVDSAGRQGDSDSSDSFEPASVSADGRFVAFESLGPAQEQLPGLACCESTWA